MKLSLSSIVSTGDGCVKPATRQNMAALTAPRARPTLEPRAAASRRMLLVAADRVSRRQQPADGGSTMPLSCGQPQPLLRDRLSPERRGGSPAEAEAFVAHAGLMTVVNMSAA